MPMIIVRTLEIVCSNLPKITKALERIADVLEKGSGQQAST